MKAILIIALLGVFQANAQDVHFAQFWNNGIQYNPATAGVIPANLRASVFYRNQWSSIGAKYQTYGANVDTRFETKGNASFGLGIDIYRDVAGDLDLGTTNAQLAFSTILDMDRHNKISIGVKGGMIQRGFDATKAQWNSQYNGGTYNGGLSSGENFNSVSEMKGDLSAGIVYAYSSSEGYMTANDQLNFKVGVAYNHILRPKFDWFYSGPDKLYGNLVFHADALIGIPNSKWSILPAVIAQFQGPSKEILIGSQFRIELKKASKVTGFVKGSYFNIGTFYRLNDALIPSITLEIDHYSIGLSYDVNLSQLRTATNGNGGFEISLKFRTPNPYLWKGNNFSRSRI
ncbi:MAG: PorP/SprF family type IX secretion system membrane protein [Crocinitomicaceae bacterium]|nr:PorP/SprF family type IX secretion system membrane protein [Crocinitomicaceae bacterium]